jgi:hypothetical protein
VGVDHVFDSPRLAAELFLRQMMGDARDLSDKAERLSYLLSEFRRELELLSKRIADGGDVPNVAPSIVFAAASIGSGSRNLVGATEDLEDLLLCIRAIDPWKWA